MEFVVGFYALLVVVLAVHHAVKRVTPKKSNKLVIEIAGIAFCALFMFIPDFRNGYIALAMIVAVAATIALSFLNFNTEPELSMDESLNTNVN